MLLKDALDNCETSAERDSINSYAVERSTVQNFSVSGLKFDVQSKNPMPWDPGQLHIEFLVYQAGEKRPDDRV